MSIDVTKLASDMLAAALPVFGKKASKVKVYAELELRKLAQTLVVIGEQLAKKKISKEEAELLINMQLHAARTVWITVEGIDVLAAEEAINAALGVAKKAVGAALGALL